MKSINRLSLQDDQITEDPEIILQEMKAFYRTLYKSASTENPDTFISSLGSPPEIKLEHMMEMEKEITEKELLIIVKSLPNNKTPGEDGLPAEFYKVFWNDIKTYLLKSYQYSFENGSLSITQRRGVLCLLPKKSDPLRLKIWRPISLLNQDYKLLAKLIAERIKISLPYLINEDQSGFIKGRYIGKNITSLLDILHYTEANDIPALLISIDFEKAFDKLEWNFIRTSLDFFSFPENIKQWSKYCIQISAAV